MLFSATLTQDPEKLKFLKLFEPKLFTSIVKRKNIPLPTGNNVILICICICLKLICAIIFTLDTVTDEPVRGDFVGKYTTPKELKEYMVLCPEENKPLTLYHLIRSKGLKRVICFVKSKLEVHRLTRLLCKLSESDTNNSPLRINEISSDIAQKTHSSFIKKFSEGHIDLYVFT